MVVCKYNVILYSLEISVIQILQFYWWALSFSWVAYWIIFFTIYFKLLIEYWNLLDSASLLCCKIYLCFILISWNCWLLIYYFAVSTSPSTWCIWSSISQVQTIKQGYLLKRSLSTRGDWKRRFFVLDSHGTLYYYRDKWSKRLVCNLVSYSFHCTWLIWFIAKATSTTVYCWLPLDNWIFLFRCLWQSPDLYLVRLLFRMHF